MGTHLALAENQVSQNLSTKWRLMSFRKIADHRGNLTAIEGERDIPFPIARVYYIYDVPGRSVRAGHAHRALRQVYFALSGSFVVHLEDQTQKAAFVMNAPDQGLYIGKGVWRHIDNFSSGAVCMVVASDIYKEADYIREHSAFLHYVAHA